MDADAVLYEVRDGIAVVTMNRPEYRNAQNGAITYGLDDAFSIVSDQDGSRVDGMTFGNSDANSNTEVAAIATVVNTNAQPSRATMVSATTASREIAATATSAIVQPLP